MTRILNDFESSIWNFYQRETALNDNKTPIKEDIVYCAMTVRNVICSYISPMPIY